MWIFFAQPLLKIKSISWIWPRFCAAPEENTIQICDHYMGFAKSDGKVRDKLAKAECEHQRK
ncbi:MAG: hypothetical protein C5B47_00805 [Verrucomicrobia bacterium]|nr:MAG: hypothetical protein C5B47_00805 [Verrucomicrobiota bacterium]